MGRRRIADGISKVCGNLIGKHFHKSNIHVINSIKMKRGAKVGENLQFYINRKIPLSMRRLVQFNCMPAEKKRK